MDNKDSATSAEVKQEEVYAGSAMTIPVCLDWDVGDGEVLGILERWIGLHLF